MLIVALSCIVLGALACYVHFRARSRTMMLLSEKIPGPRLQPVVGNALQFGFQTEDFFEKVNLSIREHGTIMRTWLGNELVIWLSDPTFAEALLTSHTMLDKGFMYDYLHPWLGEGLLTSTGLKWKQHRKLFSPAFHFKILEEFVDVFHRNDKILIQKLDKHVNGPGFDICLYITLCTLDIICETAMGVQVHAQTKSESQYVQCIRGMGDMLMKRMFKPWIHLDLLFRLSPLAKMQARSLVILHEMTNSVIKTRKQEYLQKKLNKPTTDECNDIDAKRRLAFLDLMVQAQLDGAAISNREMREEVDTFMFEGNDTTTAGICFALWALAKHQDVQAKAVEELKEIFGGSERDAAFKDLQEMKYLELVIKETQRLYASVPVYARRISENLNVGEYVLPAGSNVAINAFMLHRNPEHFPDPETFDPDRFLPENCTNRHPFCYIPFSAGPRNCIGQKFAMLEMKATISAMLRHYKLTLESPNETLRFIAELVLKSSNGIRLQLQPRDWSAPQP